LFRNSVNAVFCFLLTMGFVQAQEERKNELGLLLGGTVTPSLDTTGPGSDRLEVGAGITFQLNYARLLTSSNRFALHLEAPAVAIPLQDIHGSSGSLPLNYDSFFITPALRINFKPRSTFSPWFSAGGGYALFDESALRKDGTHNVTRGASAGALQFGGGVDIRTPIKVLFPIGLRAEVRDFYTGKLSYNVDTGGGLQHNLVFSGGFTLSF
jgi:hypothetical protein